MTVPAAGAPVYALRDVMVRRVSGPTAFELHVPELTIAHGGIAEITGFPSADIFPWFALPTVAG